MGQAEGRRRCRKPAMQPAWLPASPGRIPPTQHLRNTHFPRPGCWDTTPPHSWGLCFQRRNREGFLVFFSGAHAPPPIHSIQGMLLLSEISDVSTQIKVRLNVSTAEIPHGSRWRGGTPSLPPSPRVEQKHQFIMCFQTIQPNHLTLQMGKLRPTVRNGLAQIHSVI